MEPDAASRWRILFPPLALTPAMFPASWHPRKNWRVSASAQYLRMAKSTRSEDPSGKSGQRVHRVQNCAVEPKYSFALAPRYALENSEQYSSKLPRSVKPTAAHSSIQTFRIEARASSLR